jgi:hypothetical protein
VTVSPDDLARLSSIRLSESMNQTGVPAGHDLGTVSSTPRDSV